MVEWIGVMHLSFFLHLALSIFNLEIGSRNDDTKPNEIRRENQEIVVIDDIE